MSKGWGFTYSTVQCHIKPQNQDKAMSLQQVLKTNFPDFHNDNIITVGDSPNDESLFNPAIFPYSVGVANILHYQDKLQYLPNYITVNSEVTGFTELAEIFLQP
jgi:hydroxymethylpyrimidine pyrophosphatase-like HAD family hydrolase